MPRTRRHRLVLLALTVLGLSFWPAAAQNKDGSIELSAMYSWVRFDGDGALDDRIMPSFLLGYNFTKRHGAEIMWSTGTATPDRGDSFDVDVDILRTGYVFNAYPSEKVVSFFRLGMGLWNQSPEDHTGGPSRLEDDDTNFMLYSGGGARFFFTSWMALRVAGAIDLIAIEHGLLNGDSELTFDIGLSFLMGGREAPEKEEPPAETPTEEEAKPPGQ